VEEGRRLAELTATAAKPEAHPGRGLLERVLPTPVPPPRKSLDSEAAYSTKSK
jgi:hypothetical protein